MNIISHHEHVDETQSVLALLVVYMNDQVFFPP